MKDRTPYIEINGPDDRVNNVLASIVAHALQMVDVKTIGPVGLATQDTHGVWDLLAPSPVVIRTDHQAKAPGKASTEPRGHRAAWVPPEDVDWTAPVPVLVERYRVSKSTIEKYQQRHGVEPKRLGRPRGSCKIPPDADLNLPASILARLYRCTTETARGAKVRAAKEAGHGG